MTEHKHEQFLETFTIDGNERAYSASLYFFRCKDAINCSLLRDALHEEERTKLAGLSFEKRMHDYLLGRYAAKQAIAAIAQAGRLDEIGIRNGLFRQPIVFGLRDRAVQTSITHCDQLGAAIAFDEEMPAGIDIERVEPDRIPMLESRCTSAEREWARSAPCSGAVALTLIWTSKEAIAKTIKTGFAVSLDLFEVERIERREGCWITHYRWFTPFQAVSFAAGQYVCTIASPKRALIKPDITRLKELFDWLPPMSSTR